MAEPLGHSRLSDEEGAPGSGSSLDPVISN